MVFRKDRDDGGTSSGGVAFIGRKSLACHTVQLQTIVDDVAIQTIIFNRLIKLCSLYIPPDQLSSSDIDGVVDQLPQPFILLADFNAHIALWRWNCTDARGRLIKTF